MLQAPTRLLFFLAIFLNLSFLCSLQASTDTSNPISADTSDSKSINILSLNVMQLPWPIGMDHRSERIRKVAENILTLKPSPDVLLFQELGTKSARDILKNKLRQVYPHFYLDERMGGLGVGINSGLALFSKFPLVGDKVLVDYKSYRGAENFARKGLMGAKIQYSDKNFMYVFTTHLQGGVSNDCLFRFLDHCRGDSRNSTELRIGELVEAKAVINQFVTDPVSPIIFAGDFNMDPVREADEYEKFMEIYKKDIYPINTFSPTHSKFDSSTWYDYEHVRIDHVWILNGNEKILSSYSIITDHFDKTMTDHRGVLGIFSLSTTLSQEKMTLNQ